MIDGQEKSQKTGDESDQASKKGRDANEHIEADAHKPRKTMSDSSNVLSLFFALCLVIASFLTFLAICVQAFITNSQLKEMKKSTDAATKGC